MKTVIITAVTLTLATLSATAPVLAKGRLPNPSVGLNSVNGSIKGQTTDAAGPGDAFLPDTAAVGDPKAECIDQGGRPVRIAAEYDFEWSCKF